jgi:pSer/pThr/pTyr-binding forkhead associated (FHA) protein
VDAIVCEHCGKPFNFASDNYSNTMEVEQETRSLSRDLEEQIQTANMEEPSEGIAIYLLGLLHPIEIRLENIFIIGRLVDPKQEKVVDLTRYNAFTLGVSRRHLMVRRTGDGYEVMDLDSTNGTWVNGQRLEPQLPFAVISGQQIRLGNLPIFISFRQQISKK